MKALVVLVAVVGCSGGAEDGDHDARFIGLWAVEQPHHALYEVTYYRLRRDGSMRALASEPSNCTGHLRRHCVTGSVARCVHGPEMDPCTSDTTCVFGDEWHSRGSSTLVIAGACSDQVARDIVIEVAADASSNASFGGAGGTLVSVGDATDWSHDNFEWAFRKCLPGSDLASCSQSPF
jgi:hypothetical protein